MQIKYQIQLWFHWGCSYVQTTVGSQQITSITVSKIYNTYLQVMITRHNTRLHEVLWWQGGAGGRSVCQAGGRPPQAGPAWPGRIMLGRGRQDIQVMTRIRILLFFQSWPWSAGSSREHTAPSTARSSDQSTARLCNQNRQPLFRYLLYVVVVINNYEYKRQLSKLETFYL